MFSLAAISNARAGRSGARRRSTITFSFSGGTRPQLFRLRDYATIAFLGQSGQGQLQALRIELRIFFRPLPLVQQHDRARSEIANNPVRHFCWIAPNRVESANGP